MPEVNDAEEGVGRPFWSGILSFGLVSIPVDLLPAHRTSRGALRMVDADGTPLARRYYCPADEEEVEAKHIVRGYELDDGKVVVMTDEELEALAPKKSREIDLRLFVDRDSLDPLYFERSYFLAPGADSGKAYRLLGAVMESSRRAGIASFVMRDNEYLVAIFSEGGLLRAETLRFHDEVRSQGDVGLPKRTAVDSSAVQRMTRAVDALAEEDWNPSELTDPHAAVRELAQRKHEQGKDVVRPAKSANEGGGQIIDLMEVLRKSLAQNQLTSSKKSSGSKLGKASPRSAGRPRATKKGTRRASTSNAAGDRSSSRHPSKAAPRRKKSAARRR